MATSSGVSSSKNNQDNNNERDEIENLPILPEEQSSQYSTLIKSGSSRMRIFLIGSLLMLISSSVRPDYLDFSHRFQSFGVLLDPATAQMWAQSGFHSDGGTGAKCCQCGASTDQLAGQDPNELHFGLRPDCLLLLLLQVLSPKGRPSPKAEVAKCATRFEKLLYALSAAFGHWLIQFVESFGFSTAEVALALLKYITDGGDPDLKQSGSAGLLVQLAQSLPPAVKPLGKLVLVGLQLFDKYFLTGSGELRDSSGAILIERQPIRHEIVPSPSAISAHLASSLEAAAAASATSPTAAAAATPNQRHEEEDSNPSCVQCQRTQRNVILLPCAHLAFCRKCVQNLGNCPLCGSIILAIISAFLC